MRLLLTRRQVNLAVNKMELKCPECPTYIIRSIYDFQDHRNLYHGSKMVCIVPGCERNNFTKLRQHLFQSHGQIARQILEGVKERRRSSSVYRDEDIQCQEPTSTNSDSIIGDSHNVSLGPSVAESFDDDSESDEEEIFFGSRELDAEEIIKDVFAKFIRKKEELLVNDSQFIKLMKCIMTELSIISDHSEKNYIHEQLMMRTDTHHSIRSFIKRQFIYIEPESHVVSGKECFRVPIKSIIERKLKNAAFATCLIEAQSYQRPADGTISSFRDTESFKQDTKTLFFKYATSTNVLIIFGEIYADEFCLANPIGPFAGSSTVTGVYMNFSDIKRRSRSKRNDQHLVSIIPSNVIEDAGYSYTYNKIREELLQLEDQGFNTVIMGERFKVLFIAHKFCGDNKGIFELLGKVKCFSSGSVCRCCTATYNQIQSNPYAGNLKDEFAWTQEIEALSRGENVVGMNEEPVFIGFKYIKISNQYPQDRLHTLLLGVYPDWIELLLESVSKKENLDMFNRCITLIKLKNGSPEVRMSTGRNARSLKASGSQCYDIFLNFPELLSQFHLKLEPYPDWSDDGLWKKVLSSMKYQAYLTLRKLDCYLRQERFTENDLIIIGLLVKTFLTQRSQCCGNQTVTPKLHYLTHLVHEIKTHGPILKYDTLVYERKHSSFLRKIQTIKCRKNVSKTLVEWDSRLSAIENYKQDDCTYLSAQKQLTIEDLALTGLAPSLSQFQVKGVRIDDCDFKVNQIRSWNDGFISIKMLVSRDQLLYAYGHFYRIKLFDPLVHAFHVELDDENWISVELKKFPSVNTAMRMFNLNQKNFINKVDNQSTV